MSVSATDKFKKGDKVKMSAFGRIRLTPKYPKPGWDTGLVTGFSRDGLYVAIIQDHIKSPSNFHPDFWELIGDGE